MRFWKWGQADAEWADWHSTQQLFRTPWGPWGDTLDQGEDPGDYNKEVLALGNTQVNDLHTEALTWIEIAQIKAKLGQVPVLIFAGMNVQNTYNGSTGTYDVRIHRMLTVWDRGDTSNFYADKSALLTWYQDKHHFVRGKDMTDPPDYQFDISHVNLNNERNDWPLTTIVERALRDNSPIMFDIVVWHSSSFQIDWNYVTIGPNRPYLFFAYLYPIEFYHDDGSGNIDLSSPISDEPGEEYYLGAVEPGQTGTPTKNHVVNYSDAEQQIDVFDDHPEYTVPITRIGSSQLDFVDLLDAAVSQKYTAIFYSSTQYEVKAEAYRDNAISLHPSINADAQWRGAIGSDFFAPEGGLKIPAAAWQRGQAVDDEYEVGVRGNTTDTSWPADSNDQIEMTRDNAGVADAAGWRPVVAHREKTTAQVTVDATTKRFPTRMVKPTEWLIATKAFVMDATNINEGQVDSVEEADIGTPTFVGTGNNDITISGNYNGSIKDTLVVQIDATGTPDTFQWSLDDGLTWEETGVDCSVTDILLDHGIYVRWANASSHTLDDHWDSVLTAWAVNLSGLTADNNVYGSGALIGTTLPIRDVGANVFSTVDQASGVSQGTPGRLWLKSTAGFSAAQTVFIQNPANPSTAEYRIIDSVQAGEYIDLTVALTEDYSEGDFCTVEGSGQAAYWTRPVATVVTQEEIKRLRLVARLL